jgi:hypothetical protein
MEGSVVVEIVSITIGVEVLWCRRDGKLGLRLRAVPVVDRGTVRGLIGALAKLRKACPACLDGPATQSRR